MAAATLVGCPGAERQPEPVKAAEPAKEAAPPPPPDPVARDLVDRAAVCPFDEKMQSFATCADLDALRAHAKQASSDPEARRALADTLIELAEHEDMGHRLAATTVLEVRHLTDPKGGARRLVARLEGESSDAVASQIGRRFRGLDLIALGVSDPILGVASATSRTPLLNALMGPLGGIADRCPECEQFLTRTAAESPDVTVRGSAIRALGNGRPTPAGCETLAKLCDTEKQSPVVPFLAFAKTRDRCKDQVGLVLDAFEHRVEAKERIDNHLLGIRSMHKRGILTGEHAERAAAILRKAKSSQRPTIAKRMDELAETILKPPPPTRPSAGGDR